ncbi:phosphoheptose isomerase [Hymenobacter artigasi]|uniref:Mannose-6-phosphate isomerase-like protein (Cupin superfamily) n=1 Tax=Hymenobacter artigasi TaxID=2719616 RepID=A0ABX1HQB6_9BACT|nr:phosphoheptose isomerase [Hymenobacter artigasi]NKI91457.1 mannose-6-phosphate isomerase-like protein (cupin superfamily) [Hymenobacter artigasi]
MPHTDPQKSALFQQVAAQLRQQGFTIAKEDPTRPWGGFFVIDEAQAQEFANTYFDGLLVDSLRISGRLSPKILIVAPHQRLSWQYHHRRAEIWQVVQGPVGVAVSDSDEQSEVKNLQVGERIILRQGERHRLVGLKEWGILAEIWQHTDTDHPSDEDDIVRVQDDFGR